VRFDVAEEVDREGWKSEFLYHMSYSVVEEDGRGTIVSQLGGKVKK
jgi:hypothetical protein